MKTRPKCTRAEFVRWHREAARQMLHSLALWALVLLLAPSAQATWQCEGRACGVASWLCCCDLPNDIQDADCARDAGRVLQHKSSGEHQFEVASCPAACHCTSVAAPSQEARASSLASVLPALEVVAILPVTCQAAAPVAADCARPYESRGPPRLAEAPASASPRGPPHTDAASAPREPEASARVL
jgi:hypothetical protein